MHVQTAELIPIGGDVRDIVSTHRQEGLNVCRWRSIRGCCFR